MPLFSVIIPTYDHADTLIWAVKSVQMQAVQDFEILVMGDGVPDRTRVIMADLCGQDPRISFYDNEKGEAKGEKYRHAGVMKARGKYIAYLGDDDLWQKNHLTKLAEELENYDFCNTLHACVFPDDQISIFPGDIGDEFCRKTLKAFKHNFFGPTCVGHTKAAYERLPKGWVPAPKGMWSDLHMWRQWFAADGMKFKTIPHITTIHVDSPGREQMSTLERANESKRWLDIISDSQRFVALEEQTLRQVALEQGCYKFYAFHWHSLYTSANAELSTLRGDTKTKGT